MSELGHEPISNINRLFTKEDTKCSFFSDYKLLSTKYFGFREISDKINYQINYILQSINDTTKQNDLKTLVLDRFIIKKDCFPDSFFEYHWQEAINRGEITDTSEYSKKKFLNLIRIPATNQIVLTQRESILTWINYFISPESRYIPVEIKYWIFKRVLKLGKYNPDKKGFERRNKKTTAPFPELNQEALYEVIDIVKDRLSKNKEVPRFKKLYGETLSKYRSNTENILQNIKGQWIRFPYRSDPKVLVDKLMGKNTGLCISNCTIAQKYLEEGDLEIYFSYDANNTPCIPRVAIHITENRVNEVRGIDTNQNLDPYILPVVINKLVSLPEGKKYFSRINQGEKLQIIYHKHLSGLPLTLEDLEFIYEIDHPVETFGYGIDHRIVKILYERDNQKDLFAILGCNQQKRFSLKEDPEAQRKKYFFGNLYLTNFPLLPEGLIFPETIGGTLSFDRLRIYPLQITLPKSVDGDLLMNTFRELPKYIKFPQNVVGDLDLSKLMSIPERCKLPDIIGGDLKLPNLKNLPNNIVFPKIINGTLDLGAITHLPPGTVFPKINLKRLVLNSINVLPKNFVLPSSCEYLEFANLETIEANCIFPTKINESLTLPRLKHIPKNFIWPQTIEGDLVLPELEVISDNCCWPQYIGGSLYLDKVKQIGQNQTWPHKIKSKPVPSYPTSIDNLYT